ncbi:MAG: hypothetical protein PHF60_02360 [Candidatus ainarchaeum sp.]|nr:hypothetical protein [Candidatus ainarchaeum sp.]
MNIVEKTVAKMTLNALAKRIANVGTLVFFAIGVLYLAWKPLTGNAFGLELPIFISALVALIVVFVASLVILLTK